MEDNFNKHLGNKLKLRRLALGLTQTKVAKAINVTFQQIQKYEKGTNGVSSIRLLQLSNYLKVPINYFFEDFSEYLINLEKSPALPTELPRNIKISTYFFFSLKQDFFWRQRPESNRDTRICNPLRNHSATLPYVLEDSYTEFYIKYLQLVY